MSHDKGLNNIEDDLGEDVASHLAEKFIEYCEWLLSRHAAFQVWLEENGHADAPA